MIFSLIVKTHELATYEGLALKFHAVTVMKSERKKESNFTGVVLVCMYTIVAKLHCPVSSILHWY